MEWKTMIELTETIMKYRSAWGVFTIPRDVYYRSLKAISGPDYLDRWCKFQYEKNLTQSK
jgi:hypothetical protein